MEEEDAWDYYYPFVPPPEEVRRDVLARLEAVGINIVPYNTNAELSILALGFVEDNERNLLFLSTFLLDASTRQRPISSLRCSRRG